MTPAEAAEWVAAANQGWIEETAASWTVAALGGGLVGRTTLGALNLDGGQADVRYWVVPAARGRRIAPGALSLLTTWAITDLGLHRLELEHSTRNSNSRRVAEHAGYLLEGIRRSQLLHDDGWHDMHLHARITQADPAELESPPIRVVSRPPSSTRRTGGEARTGIVERSAALLDL